MSTPFFIAIELKQDAATDLRILTPKVMDFGQGIWLMDLGPTASYWQKKADAKNLHLTEFLPSILEELAPQGYRAGRAKEPFRALLLTALLQEKNLHGLIDSQSPFGSSLFQQLSWQCFWSIAEASLPHFLACNAKKCHINHFQKDRRLMERAMKRLHLTTPRELSFSSKSAIYRRFGPLIAKMWQWTYGTSQEACLALEDGFPFVAYDFKDCPQKSRTLDFPLLGWQHIEPLLASDLDMLCFHPSYKEGDLITSLEWSITLQDLKCLTVPIPFRHPHNLRADPQVALLQAYYQFLHVSQGYLKEYQEAEISPPPVVSWDLRVTGLMPQRQKILDLFEEELLEHKELMRLENQLAIPLMQYEVTESWCPEESFRPYRAGKKEAFSMMATPSMRVLNHNRPLFIYKKPIPLKGSGPSLKRFLERTMDRWWHDKDKNQQKDYYLLIDEKKRHLWSFQDNKGDWYAHGIFA